MWFLCTFRKMCQKRDICLVLVIPPFVWCGTVGVSLVFHLKAFNSIKSSSCLAAADRCGPQLLFVFEMSIYVINLVSRSGHWVFVS